MGRVNIQWHQEHKMPVHPSLEQKGQWFLEHSKNCQCWSRVKKSMEKKRHL